MANDELFQALQMFTQGAQQAATSAAVNDATTAMHDIKNNITDQAQQRQQLDSLSRQLALRLSGTGASGSTINSAFSAIAPQSFGSAEQMQLEGQLSGNKQLIDTSASIIGDRRKAALNQLDYEAKIASSAAEKKFGYDSQLEMIKAGGKGVGEIPGFRLMPGVKPTDKDVEELKGTAANYDIIKKALEKLDSKVADVGTEAISFGGNDKAEMLQTRDYINLQLKELEKLGALAGPDIEILTKVVPDPTAWKTSRYEEQSRNFKTLLDDKINSRAKARGAVFTGATFANPKEESVANDPRAQAIQWLKANPNHPKADAIMQALRRK